MGFNVKRPFIWITIALILTNCTDASRDFFSGYAEANYVRLSSPIAGHLVKVYLSQGDQVARNAPAFILEQENERAAREEALARVRHAQALLTNLKKGKRPEEIAAIRAQLAQAIAAAQLSSANLARETQLVAAHFLSPARLDEMKAARARDQAQVREWQAQLRVAHLTARRDEIHAAEQDLLAAQAQLAQATWRLEQKIQHTPTAATVVDVLYREGELVPAGSPIVTLLPPQNIKARFFVPETTLGTLHINQAVTLQCDGCGTAIAAKITFISPEAQYTAPLIYSKENRSSLVFMVEAQPSPTEAQRLHPGQPLEIRLVPPAPAGRP